MAPWRWRLANVLGLMTHTNRIIRGRWIVGAAVIAVLAGACGGGGSSGGGSSGGGGGSASGGQVVEIDVASSGFAYAETTATATAGHVVIKSMNPQSTGHDISLKGNGVDVHVLLLGAGPRGRRHEGHPDRQLAGVLERANVGRADPRRAVDVNRRRER